eukprot:Awhi_evm1s824
MEQGKEALVDEILSIQFNTLVENPTKKADFVSFLIKLELIAHLDFIKEVERFRKHVEVVESILSSLCTVERQTQVKEFEGNIHAWSQEIFSNYIVVSGTSRRSIHLAPSTLNKVANHLSKNKIDAYVFDECADEVYNLLIEYFHRFEAVTKRSMMSSMLSPKTSNSKQQYSANADTAVSFSESEFKQYLEIANKMAQEIEMKDRTYLFKTYKNVFLASDAVNWFLLNQYAVDTLDSISLGSILNKLGIISHVSGDVFENKPLFFRLTSRPSSSSSISSASAISSSASIATQDHGDLFKNQLVSIIAEMKLALPLQDCTSRLKNYKCFTGINCAKWLISSGTAADEFEAIELGNHMIEMHLFERLGDGRKELILSSLLSSSSSMSSLSTIANNENISSSPSIKKKLSFSSKKKQSTAPNSSGRDPPSNVSDTLSTSVPNNNTFMMCSSPSSSSPISDSRKKKKTSSDNLDRTVRLPGQTLKKPRVKTRLRSYSDTTRPSIPVISGFKKPVDTSTSVTSRIPADITTSVTQAIYTPIIPVTDPKHRHRRSLSESSDNVLACESQVRLADKVNAVSISKMGALDSSSSSLQNVQSKNIDTNLQPLLNNQTSVPQSEKYPVGLSPLPSKLQISAHPIVRKSVVASPLNGKNSVTRLPKNPSNKILIHRTSYRVASVMLSELESSTTPTGSPLRPKSKPREQFSFLVMINDMLVQMQANLPLQEITLSKVLFNKAKQNQKSLTKQPCCSGQSIIDWMLTFLEKC